VQTVDEVKFNHTGLMTYTAEYENSTSGGWGYAHVKSFDENGTALHPGPDKDPFKLRSNDVYERKTRGHDESATDARNCTS
jgi:hypothetical protein